MKMMEEHINQTINQIVFFLMFQKYMKDAFTVNYPVSLIKIFFQNGALKMFSTQLALPVMIEVRKIPERTKNFGRLFSQIYQKLLTVSVTISSLQNLTLVDSIEMR